MTRARIVCEAPDGESPGVSPGAFQFSRPPEGDQPMVGMTNSDSVRMPEGQRVVIVFSRV